MIALLAGGCAPWQTVAKDDGGIARQAPDASLQPFYDQVLDWQPCGGRNLCAELEVPLDYDDPGAGTVEVAVLRSPSTGPRPQGSLVVNPGGPGGSGTQFAEAAARIASPPLRSAFSIVGFDPRGVGRSDPLECLSDAETDEFLAVDPSPDDDAEVGFLGEQVRRMGQGCLTDDAQLAAHVDTGSVVRDMDILRAALDEPALNYLGFSYGTLLGAKYAEQFPDKVGRFVLDGGIDPSLSGTDISAGQAVGFEIALQRYLRDCVEDVGCPLGGSEDEARATLEQLLANIDTAPLPTNDPERPLTQGLALTGIIFPLYQPQYGWPLLTVNLRQALLGDGSGLLEAADLYAQRGADGRYEGNSIDAIYAVNCLDNASRPGPVETAELASRWSVDAPLFGPVLAYSNLACHYWPIPGKDTPAPVAASGAPPILVVGTEFDPATPYQWSQALADQLESGVLLSWRGADGHTAYRNGSACIDDAIDTFLIEGVLPADGSDCLAVGAD